MCFVCIGLIGSIRRFYFVLIDPIRFISTNFSAITCDHDRFNCFASLPFGLIRFHSVRSASGRLHSTRFGSLPLGCVLLVSLRYLSARVHSVGFHSTRFSSISLYSVRFDSFDSVRFDKFRLWPVLLGSIPFTCDRLCSLPLGFIRVRFVSIPMPVPFGSVWSGWVRCWNRFGCVPFASIRLDTFPFGSVRFGSIRFGLRRFDSVGFHSIRSVRSHYTPLHSV